MDEHPDYINLNDEIRNDIHVELGDDLLNMDDDPIDYINFSDDEIIEEMPLDLGDDISNALTDNIPNVIPLTPTKNSNILIEVGMEFSEQKDVLDLYTAYGKVKGFGIRIRTRRGNYFRLVCARQGHPPQKKDKDVAQVCQTKLKKTSSIRIGCEAYVSAYKSENTKMWKITQFNDKHNHGLVTPKSVRYLRSHKKMSDVARSLVERFSDASLPTGKVATIFKGDELSFDSRDCYNHLKSVRRRIYNTGDAQAVLHYCVKQQSLNPKFFFSIKCDDEDRMESFFWIDARSRQAYELFGDVITFDTTYRTNKYSMPFGPFVGVNNHLQSILFGCALLKDETEDTFVWLFKEWLRGMNWKHPGAIITDQDMSITNAVSKVFPKSKHRFCMWHITKKFPEKLSHVYQQHATFKSDFNNCIHTKKSTQDFEDKWQRILDNFGLHENEWLQSLYSIKSSWIPIFNRSIFFAGMNTTQRSESINSFFDGFVTSGTTLKEFVEKYNQAVDARYDSFKKQDFESRHKERRLTLNMPLEEHAAKVYTRAIFTKFSDLLSHSFPLSKEKLGNDGEWVTYQVFNRKEKDYSATVKMKLVNRETRCSCQYFEFMGVPCEHIIAVFSVENVEQIPEHMILRRWSKEGNDIISTNKEICNFDGEGLLRGFEIRNRVSKLIKLADRSNEAAKFACDGLDSLTESLEKFPTPDDSTGLEDFDSHYLSSQTEESSMMRLNDPNISQTKGRKRESHNISQGRRIHSGIEEASKNTNICGNCKKRGHNKRTCREKNLH